MVFSDQTKIAAFTWGEIKREAVTPEWFQKSNLVKHFNVQQKDLVKDLIEWEKKKTQNEDKPIQNKKLEVSIKNKKMEVSIKNKHEELAVVQKQSSIESELEDSMKALRAEREV